jgi:hypothetical protein
MAQRTELRYQRPCAMTGCRQPVKHDHFCDRCHEKWGDQLNEPWAHGLRQLSDEQAKLMRRIRPKERPLDPKFGLPRSKK